MSGRFRNRTPAPISGASDVHRVSISDRSRAPCRPRSRGVVGLDGRGWWSAWTRRPSWRASPFGRRSTGHPAGNGYSRQRVPLSIGPSQTTTGPASVRFASTSSSPARWWTGWRGRSAETPQRAGALGEQFLPADELSQQRHGKQVLAVPVLVHEPRVRQRGQDLVHVAVAERLLELRP